MATRKGKARTKKSETSTKSASKKVKSKETAARTGAKKAEAAVKQEEKTAVKTEPKKVETVVKAEQKGTETVAKVESKKVEAAVKAESKKAETAAKVEPKKVEAAVKAEPEKAKAAVKTESKKAVSAETGPVKAPSATVNAEAKKSVPAAKEAEKKPVSTAKEAEKKPVSAAKEAEKKPVSAAKEVEKKPVSSAKVEEKKPVSNVKAESADIVEKSAPSLKTEEKKTATEAEPEKAEIAAEKAAKTAVKAEPEKVVEAAVKAEPQKTEKAAVKAEPGKVVETAVKAEPQRAEKAAPEAEEKKSETAAKTEEKKPEPAPELPQPRRSVAFIGSECYPFVKTGGLGDVMSALPRALVAQNIDVHVILPRYKCIKEEWQNKMIYKGAFEMDLCSDGKSYYVGIMEYVHDGVVYDFIDNEDFFSWGNPYTNLVDDIPKFCYFDKAALAALNYMNWIPDVIHCHDWQAGLVPLYLREMFNTTPLARSKVIITIHNLRFQGVYNIPTIKYWTNLPDYVFNKDVMSQEWTEANMLKGGMTYSNMITTVSHTYAQEIQTPEYGEGLDAHLRYHSGKLRGIVNGIDTQMWDPSSDKLLEADYTSDDVLEKKKINKRKLQEELGLEQDENKFVIGLISRLTDQKGLDLVNAIMPQIIDGNTQFVVLGTGEPQYEDSFRYYENTNKGTVCSNIMYDEGRAHKIYAGADALLVPSRFEPCGLTQLISMHYGTIPIVRETGGLKDTVLPYNQYTNEGNGFTFDRYESGLLLDAINRAKTVYFTNREHWDDMIVRDMKKDVSWNVSAKQYRQLYLDLTQ